MKCTMKEPDVHPACVAAGREFEPEGWQLQKRATTCKPCNSVRNAVYRAKRAGADEEAARQRAKTGALGAPVSAAPRAPRVRPDGQADNAPAAPRRRRLDLPEMIGSVLSYGDGKVSARVTTVAPDRIEDFTRADTPPGEGATCVACPECGRRGELRRPKAEWAQGIVRHIVAYYSGRPRLVDYCTLGRGEIGRAIREVESTQARAAHAQRLNPE